MIKFLTFCILFSTLITAAKAGNNCEPPNNKEVICVISGGTADMEKAQSLAHARSLALKTARLLAYEKMAEKLKGVIVGAQNSLGNELLSNQQINTMVKTTIRSVNIEKESVSFLADGSPWAEVTISVPRFGGGGKSKKVMEFTSSTSLDLTSENGVKTILLDLRGLEFKPSLLTSIKSESGKEVYSSKLISLKRLNNSGYPYKLFSNINEAMKSNQERSTIVIKPTRVENEEIILSNDDALKFIKADLVEQVISNNNLVVVY